MSQSGGVTPEQINEIKQLVLEAQNSIGTLRFQTNSTNPNEILGFGTWELWGKGKVPIGVNPNDVDFNTVKKIGGSKTVNIAHSHTINSHTHTLNNHTHTTNNSSVLTSGSTTLTINQMPSHRHNLHGRIDRRQGTGEVFREIFGYNETHGGQDYNVETYATGGGQGHTHTVPAHNHGNTGASNASTSGTSLTTNSGGNATLSIVQPYITCYIFKRTA